MALFELEAIYKLLIYKDHIKRLVYRRRAIKSVKIFCNRTERREKWIHVFLKDISLNRIQTNSAEKCEVGLPTLIEWL